MAMHHIILMPLMFSNVFNLLHFVKWSDKKQLIKILFLICNIDLMRIRYAHQNKPNTKETEAMITNPLI